VPRWVKILLGVVVVAAVPGGAFLLLLTYFAAPREGVDSLPPLPSFLPGSKSGFLNAMGPVVSTHVASTQGQLLALAWLAWESNFGINTGYRKGNNPGNLTVGSGRVYGGDWDGHSSVNGPDTAVSGNTVTKITQAWRSYTSLQSGWDDTYAFIGQPQFGQAQAALEAGDASGFVNALAAGRYFTLPVNDFVDANGDPQIGYLAGVNQALAAVQSSLPSSDGDDSAAPAVASSDLTPPVGTPGGDSEE
jgi:hypothetical protein